MSPTLKFACAAFALVAAFAPAAHADINDIRASDRAVDIQFGAEHQRYGETINNTTFDSEEGWLPALNAGATWLINSSSPNFNDTYLNVNAQVAVGTNNYDGGIQSCVGLTCTVTPFKSTTDNVILHVDGKIGHFFAINDWAAVVPYLNVGFRYWYRDINGGGIVSNSVERYEAGDVMGGVMVQISPMPRLVMSLAGAGGGTFSASMSTSSARYRLGSSPVYQAMGRVGYMITPTMEAIGTFKAEGFGFGRSQLVGGSSYEPDSFTHQITALAGFAYHL